MSDNRPLFQIPGNRAQTADQITVLLAAADLQIYRRNGRLVQRIDDGCGGVCPKTLKIIHVRTLIDKVAKFAKWDSRSELYAPCDPPANVASAILRFNRHAFPEYQEGGAL